MASLLIRSIRYLVTCDDKDQLLEDVDLYCEDGFIRQIGPHLDVAADRTIDASHMLCSPATVFCFSFLSMHRTARIRFFPYICPPYPW